MTVSNHTRRNIWSHYIFIFFRFAPFGSPFLCSGEGHLQAGARGAHKAGRRTQRFALLQSSYRNELSCLPAAGELRPFSPRILHCFDNEGIQQCSQGEHLRNRLCRIKLAFFIWVKISARKKQTALTYTIKIMWLLCGVYSVPIWKYKSLLSVVHHGFP